jgi:hypothetical protein
LWSTRTTAFAVRSHHCTASDRSGTGTSRPFGRQEAPMDPHCRCSTDAAYALACPVIPGIPSWTLTTLPTRYISNSVRHDQCSSSSTKYSLCFGLGGTMYPTSARLHAQTSVRISRIRAATCNDTVGPPTLCVISLFADC